MPKLEMEQEGNADALPVPVAMELSIICAATIGDVDDLHAILDEARRALMHRIGAYLGSNDRVFLRSGETRLATQEELLACVLRKMHMRGEGPRGIGQICSTRFVSSKNLTDNPVEVTCKLCIAERIRRGNEPG